MTKIVFLALILMISSCAHRGGKLAEIRSVPKFSFSGELVSTCRQNTDCELAIFKEIARIYRPSKEEKAMREALEGLLTEAKAKLWNNSPALSAESDAAGNLLIRIPATGVFAKGSHPTIALQSHMDMVLAVKDARPDEDRRPYFREGVELAETEGWLHARDYRTTLGADDGIGIAVSLRYLLDPALSHPPLELVFTADEEAGMSGIRNFALPLAATEFISLDSPDLLGGQVTVGSMGGKRAGVTGEIPLAALPAGMRVLSLKLSGLRGGHSGLDINYDRVNGIKAFASVLTAFRKKHPATWLVEMKSGGVLNQIPTSYAAQLAIPSAESFASVREELQRLSREYVRAHKDEEQSVALTVEEVATVPKLGIAPERFALLLRAMEKIPNGVLKKGKKFPGEVRTSSNLATLFATPGETTAKVEITTYSRSFVASDLKRAQEKIHGAIAGIFRAGETAEYVDPKAVLPPWVADSQSGLLRKVLKNSGFYSKTSLCPCGLELGFVAEKFPRMQIISIGARLENAHTVNERVEIASISRLSRALAKVLATP